MQWSLIGWLIHATSPPFPGDPPAHPHTVKLLNSLISSQVWCHTRWRQRCHPSLQRYCWAMPMQQMLVTKKSSIRENRFSWGWSAAKQGGRAVGIGLRKFEECRLPCIYNLAIFAGSWKVQTIAEKIYIFLDQCFLLSNSVTCLNGYKFLGLEIQMTRLNLNLFKTDCPPFPQWLLFLPIIPIKDHVLNFCRPGSILLGISWCKSFSLQTLHRQNKQSAESWILSKCSLTVKPVVFYLNLAMTRNFALSPLLRKKTG